MSTVEKIAIRIGGRDEFALLIPAGRDGYRDQRGWFWHRQETGEFEHSLPTQTLRGVVVPSLVTYTKREAVEGQIAGYHIRAFDQDIGTVLQVAPNGAWDVQLEGRPGIMDTKDSCEEAIETLVEIWLGERDERLESELRLDVETRRARERELRAELAEMERRTNKIVNAIKSSNWYVLEDLGVIEDRDLKSLSEISPSITLDNVL